MQTFLKRLIPSFICLMFVHSVSSGCGLPDSSFINARISEKSMDIPGDGPNTGPEFYNCLSVDQNSPSNYKSLLVTITFTIPGTNYYVRYALDCVNGMWEVNNSSIRKEYLSLVPPSELFLNASFVRTDCYQCRLNASNSYGCAPCHPDCPNLGENNAAGLCYGPSASECCAYIHNGVCTAECPTNFTHNPSSNCVCTLNRSGPDCSVCSLSCGNGTVDSTCSVCDCNPDYFGAQCENQHLSCTNSSCNNGGVCTDGIGPNNYTCSCVNMWGGANCDMCGVTGCLNNAAHNSNCTGCSCTGNWIGPVCDTCGFTSCENNAAHNSNCTGCSCTGNWIGPVCDTCGFTSCENSGTHNSTCTGCDCVGNWVGSVCDTCGFMPCQNSGTHNLTCTGCDCVGNWAGTVCDTCGFTTCQNSGVHNPTCTACDCVGNWMGSVCDTCGFTTCQNSGTHNPTCTGCNCVGNWVGSVCDTCGFTSCQNNGTHNSTCTGCDCVGNWMETVCDTCGLALCENSGTHNPSCTGCDCINPWGGNTCSQCQQNCFNGGSANTTCSGCNCIGDWVGTTCDTCALMTQCQHGSTPNSVCTACQCPAGLTGKLCTDDVDLCLPVNPCGIGGNCTDLPFPQTYTCVCDPSYELVTTPTNSCVPVNRCDSNPCHSNNSLACTDLAQDFLCSCVPDTTGKDCSIVIDDCLGNLCLNNGRCVDGNATYSCHCVGGFTGMYCESCNISCSQGMVNGSCLCETPCDLNPCTNGGVCSIDGSTFQCNCTGTGYSGTNCSIPLNLCDPNPCKNGGSCRQEMSGYMCDCLPGFGGMDCACDRDCDPNTEECDLINSVHQCVCKTGFIKGLSNCIEVDECLTFPCYMYANCTNTFGSYNCECMHGFEGDGFTCTGINECSVHYPLCGEYPARCVDKLFNYECVCPSGYTVEIDTSRSTLPYCFDLSCHPKTCVDIDECANADICGPNQNCINTQGGYICECEQGYFPGSGQCVPLIGLLICKGITDGTGTTFPDTSPGVTVNKQCPNTRYGLISRTCLPSCDCIADKPQWGYSRVEECVTPELDMALNRLRKLSITKSTSQSELESTIGAVWLLAQNAGLKGMDLEVAAIFIQEVEQVVEDWNAIMPLSLGISSLEQLLHIADSLLSNSAESWEETDNATLNILSIVDTVHKIANRVSIYLYKQNLEYYSFNGASFSFRLLTWANYSTAYARSNLQFPTQSSHSINLPFVDSTQVMLPGSRTPQECKTSLLFLRISTLAVLLNASLTGSARRNPCINLLLQTPSQKYEFQGEYLSVSATRGVCVFAAISSFSVTNQILISLQNSPSYHEDGRTFLNTRLNSVESYRQSQQAYTEACTLTSTPNDDVVEFECPSSGGYMPLLISPIQPPMPYTTLTLTLLIKTFLGLSALCCLIALVLILFRIFQFRKGITFVRANVILTILIAFVIFVIGIDRSEVEWVCTMFAILMQYFAFCTTLWSVLDMINVILVVTKYKKVFYDVIFASIGYLLPAVPIPFSVTFNLCSYQRVRLYCWPSSETDFNVQFAITVPLYISVLVAIVLAVTMLLNTFLERTEFRERTMRRCIQFLNLHFSSCTLPFLLVVTWILATYGFDRDEELIGHQITFIIVSSLTAVFCLIAYCIASSEKFRFYRSDTGMVKVKHGSEPNTNETRVPSKARASLINPLYTEEDEKNRASAAYSSHKLPQNELEDLEIFIQEQESLLIAQN